MIRVAGALDYEPKVVAWALTNVFEQNDLSLYDQLENLSFSTNRIVSGHGSNDEVVGVSCKGLVNYDASVTNIVDLLNKLLGVEKVTNPLFSVSEKHDEFVLLNWTKEYASKLRSEKGLENISLKDNVER